jgi:hypothetical protein
MTRVAYLAVMSITERCCAPILLDTEVGVGSNLLVPLLALCFAVAGVRVICLTGA